MGWVRSSLRGQDDKAAGSAVQAGSAAQAWEGGVMIIGAMTTTTFSGGALRLADWGLIRAQGADAASFLHGQLTQDVTALGSDSARLAGFCSAKGRLQASFVLWRQPVDTATDTPADTLMLACSADLLAPTLKRLSMFVLRSQCKLRDASGDTALYGLVGEAAAQWLGEALPAQPWRVCSRGLARVIRLPDAEGQLRCLLAQPADAAAPALPLVSDEQWRWLEVRSGVARVMAATAEHFVPQMINFELVGGVNFQKGCYPGQEVVARSQYRGTLKRRAMLFDSDAVLAPGQEVFHSADPGQPAGQVVLAASRPDGPGGSALVEVKLAALAQGSLHAGSAEGPLLRPAALPYPIPADQG